MTQKDLMRFFPGCLMAHLLLFFGMLTTDRLYIDDIGRSVRGYSDWTELGARPLADLFITFLNLGTPLINTFPLPQLISIGIAAVASVYLAKAFSIESRLMAALATLPLAGQPYFLENMSYSFDSPFMTFSLLLSIAAAIQLFSQKKYQVIHAVLLLFCAINMYQATLGAFCVTVLFLMIHHLSTQMDPLSFLVRSLLKALAAGAVSFALYVPVLKIIPLSAYVNQHDSMVGFDGGHIQVAQNIDRYVSTLVNDWSVNVTGWIFIALFGLTLVLALVQMRRWARDTDKSAWHALFYGCVALLVLSSTWIASYFPQLLLEHPKWAVRTFTGIGAVLSCCALYCGSANQRLNRDTPSVYRQWWVAVPIGILAFALISFAYAYAKANTEQKYYEDAILTRIAADIETIGALHKIVSLSYIGTIGSNSLLQNSQKKYPLLTRLVPMHIRDNWIWGYRQMIFAGVGNLEWQKVTEEEMAYLGKNLKPVVSKTRYSIYLLDDRLIVDFKEKTS